MKGFRVWFNLGVLSALAIGLANCSSAPSTFVTMPSATQSGPVPTQAKIPPELLVSPFPQRWDDTGVLIEGVLPSRKYGQYRLTNVWQSVVENGVQAIYAGESKEVARGSFSSTSIRPTDRSCWKTGVMRRIETPEC